MIEILLDHRAVIDEIIGDGILAFFGAPEPMEDHPVQAVACALAMQAAMDEVNALNHADGLPHLEMGIAVNTGTVVVGNIGSERRTKYSVVGADVNFAVPHRILCGGGAGAHRRHHLPAGAGPHQGGGNHGGRDEGGSRPEPPFMRCWASGNHTIFISKNAMKP